MGVIIRYIWCYVVEQNENTKVSCAIENVSSAMKCAIDL